MEAECFKARRSQPGKGSKEYIYREQWDGSQWSVMGVDGEPIDEEKEDVIQLNFSLNWYSPNSSSRAPQQSVGPISAQIANLPNMLRGSMQLNLLLGVTPGWESLSSSLMIY